MHFAIELKPYFNESLNSWLIRNSIANGSDPSSFYIALWGNYRAWRKDIDKSLPTKQINILSKYISLDNKTIRSLTLEPYIQKIMGKDQLNPLGIWYFLVPLGRRGSINVNGMQFCHKCLSLPNPYLKKQWRLSWNIACPIHKIKLHMKCQKCNSVFIPYRVTYDASDFSICNSCGFDLKKSLTQNTDVLILEFQDKLNRALFHNSIDSSFPIIDATPHDLFTTLRIFSSFFKYILKRKKYKHILKNLSIDAHHVFKKKSNNTFEMMDINDREYILGALSKLFTFSLDEIKILLQESDVTSKIFNKNPLISSPTIDYLLNNLKAGKIYASPKINERKIFPKEKHEVDMLYKNILQYI